MKAIYKVTSTTPASCPVCSNGSHHLSRCYSFREWDPKKKNDFVRAQGFCYNCLQKGHSLSECPSKGTCKECKKRHHTSLHDSSKLPAPAVGSSGGPTEQTSVYIVHKIDLNEELPLQEVHPTGAVTIWDRQQAAATRSFIDHGAAASLINEGLATRLQLSKNRKDTIIGGFVGQMTSKYMVEIAVANLAAQQALFQPPGALQVECYVVKDVNCFATIPDYYNKDLLQLMEGKQPWADPEHFHHQPIELLLSTKAIGDARLAATDVIKTKNGSLVADKYTFGWVVNGSMPAPLQIKPSPAICTIKTEQDEEENLLDQELNRLWQIEEVTSKDAEAIYKETSSRDPSGRYVISLPKKEPAPLLGESRPVAICHFM